MWVNCAKCGRVEWTKPPYSEIVHKVAAKYVYIHGLYTQYLCMGAHTKMINTFSVAFKLMCTWNKLEQLTLK